MSQDCSRRRLAPSSSGSQAGSYRRSWVGRVRSSACIEWRSRAASMLDVETPALLLYRDVMERNLKTMAGRAKKLGVSLRPHIKTHKCLELGRRQVALGAQGITVSTLFEAQAFARGGFTDLTWAFPLDPSHVPHAQRIARDGVTLRVILDDLDTAKALAGSGLHVWLKVDCGYHRAGVDPSSRYGLEVARELGAE